METRWSKSLVTQKGQLLLVINKWGIDLDMGGLPMTDFVIFGCLIRNNYLWIYGYKQDRSPWFL